MRKALTVGELLVTMAIIGVIATLVLPGFMKDYHNKIYTARLKKVYEMIGTAINQACIDSNVSYFSQTPYIATATQGLVVGSVQQDFIDKYFKKTNNNSNLSTFAATYRMFDKDESISSLSLFLQTAQEQRGIGTAKLAGGEAIAFICKKQNLGMIFVPQTCEFHVDVNGTDGPNIFGRDYFLIKLDYSTNKLNGGAATSCGRADAGGNATFTEFGEGCLTRIMEDNWEMKY